ncbi:nucleotide sugar dehydrogenase [Methanomicrobium antiquum]|uniref:UDP-N-acetyl-D-mannosamine dehydrogenase n=1 Tax=Methanomicrobium antiquum TaxID=487686 RepID=A0AAF0FPR8_9EURY|nr:nucleotide sugar dehydrogenase [Methanomicrobium antiquum]WFN37410.1 nucleotide sugar dehydrogenase [Methanomicrobium antiquum]
MPSEGSINFFKPVEKIGVIGMGYVGIPSAVLFADVPHFKKVYGFQRNSESSGYKIDMLNSGISPLKGDEPGLKDLLKKVVSENKFECTSDFSKISECDVITLAIQTPFKNRDSLIPDFTPLKDGLEKTGRYMSKGSLVVLESTITPGTTEGMAKEILETESGLVAGKDFFLAHAPERVMVGRLLQNIREHDRIVGGISSYKPSDSGEKLILDGPDSPSTKRAIELYSPVLTKGKIIPMSATAAEVTKTAENTFRDLQIAAANQLALYCEAMGINFYDVFRGVDSLKGEGITRAMLLPGAGVGGHCLTKDTYHLERGIKIAAENSAKIANTGLNAGSPDPLDFPKGKDSLYVLARQINDFMPHHMLTLTKSALRRAGKDIKGSKIALLGWAFLANSDDARDTPSEVYYNLCKEEGACVFIHDPHVLKYPGVEISQSPEDVLKGADAVAILAGHREYYQMRPEIISGLINLKNGNPVIIDGRNVILPDAWIDKGFVYKGIGRGDKNGHPVRLDIPTGG